MFRHHHVRSTTWCWSRNLSSCSTFRHIGAKSSIVHSQLSHAARHCIPIAKCTRVLKTTQQTDINWENLPYNVTPVMRRPKGPFIATQLNSSQLDVDLSSVEFSCVAINGPLLQRLAKSKSTAWPTNHRHWDLAAFEKWFRSLVPINKIGGWS